MNKTNALVIVAVAVLFISFLNLVIMINKINDLKTITGYGSSEAGYANVTVESWINVNFTIANLSWGSGIVNLGSASAILDTSAGTVANGNWSAVDVGLTLENIGNSNVSLTLQTADTAATLLGGGDTTDYEWNLTSSDGGCTASEITLGLFEDVNQSFAAIACDPLDFIDTKDSLRIDIRLNISSDSATGELSDTITATATAD